MKAAPRTWRGLGMAIVGAIAALLVAFLIVEALNRATRPVLDSSWAGEQAPPGSTAPPFGRGDLRAEP